MRALSQKRKDADAAPPPGSLIAGRYRVGSPIAIGGMGVVVNAFDENERRAVAVKILRHSSAGSIEATARLFREARLLLQLESLHLVRVLDVGALEAGEPYLVMELLEGSDLEQMLRGNGPLPIGAAVDYMLQACVGLAVAHRLGVVHRDIKPSNLFLAHQPAGEAIVKVIDFGVCKAAFAGGPALTLDRHLLGSPSYMSPEQCVSSREVDARSDVWSLGVTLHRLCSGRLPFEGVSPAEKMFHIATSQPAPLRRHAHSAPAALEAIVLRCLEKDRDKRYADVGELAEALAPLSAPSSRSYARRARRLIPQADLPDEQTVLRATVDQELPTLRPAAPDPPTRRPPAAGAVPGKKSPWVTKPAPAAQRTRRRRLLNRAALIASGLILAGALVLAAM